MVLPIMSCGLLGSINTVTWTTHTTGSPTGQSDLNRPVLTLFSHDSMLCRVDSKNNSHIIIFAGVGDRPQGLAHGRKMLNH